MPLFERKSVEFPKKKKEHAISPEIVDENLLHLEKTLKALNLDLQQSVRRLEKPDFPDEINYSSLLVRRSSAGKVQDDKRSSTPDTGFASRETNLSLSLHGSSPHEPLFFQSSIDNSRNSRSSSRNNLTSSPGGKPTNPSFTSVYSPHNIQNSPILEYSSSRQRSLSFTENYGNISSSAFSDYPNRAADNNRSFRRKPTQYKPRSIKARTIRRLSYNPMTIASSSSSETEADHSFARSECDIRSNVKMTAKQRRQYYNRKGSSQQNPCSVNSSSTGSRQNKMYGSNTSIRSEPHFSCFPEKSPIPQKFSGAFDFGYNEKLKELIEKRNCISRKLMQHTKAQQAHSFDYSFGCEKIGSVYKPPKTAGPSNGSGGAFPWPDKIFNPVSWRTTHIPNQIFETPNSSDSSDSFNEHQLRFQMKTQFIPSPAPNE